MNQKPLKILHLVNHVHNHGNGIVNVVVDLAVEQCRRGHDVTVASSGGEFVALLEAHQVCHLWLPQTGKRSVAALAHLSLFVRRERVDVVHAHMMTGALIARLATTFTRTRVVTTIHNSWQRHAILMRAGHRIIAVSEAVRQEMIRRGVPSGKLHTVLNGTSGSVRGSVAMTEDYTPFEHPAVLCVAGHYERKGIADLIKATALLREHIPDVKVYLAGDGPERQALEKQAKTLGLDKNVIFLGLRRDVSSLLNQTDLFVLPSHSEPFGLVLIEARCAGVPVVATQVGGIPEALDGGKAGMLVPPHDPLALAQAIAGVLQDKAMRLALQRAGQENLQFLHVRRVSDETLNVYRIALGLPA